MPLRWLSVALLCSWVAQAPGAAGVDSAAAANSAGSATGRHIRSPGFADPADASLQDLMLEIGDAACVSDTQCHTVAVGAKPCGGPEAYLPWSDAVSRAATLNELAARQRKAREEANARSGAISNCALVPDPGAVCRPRATDGKRVCQRGAGGAAQAR